MQILIKVAKAIGIYVLSAVCVIAFVMVLMAIGDAWPQIAPRLALYRQAYDLWWQRHIIPHLPDHDNFRWLCVVIAMLSFFGYLKTIVKQQSSILRHLESLDARSLVRFNLGR
jgi:hypothetical protein